MLGDESNATFTNADLSTHCTVVEMQDNNVYRSTCPSGHENVIHVQNQKFELLFDSGALALLDGYPREAVSSLAASLERFYEFFIRVKLGRRKAPHDALAKTWKLVRSQSERQLGAFLFLYLLENNKVINFDIQKYTEFRNKVIHQGYIPSTQEVIDVAEQMLAFMRDVLDELQAEDQEIVHEMFFQEATKVAVSNTNNAKIATAAIPTILGLHIAQESRPKTFADALAGLRRWRPYG